MNGRFLLDTNAVVALPNGHSSLNHTLQSATWIGISIITELEFSSFSGLSLQDEELFLQFKTRVEIVDLQASDAKFLQRIVDIRKTSRLKLPDAIISAAAIENMAILLTLDAEFSKVDHLSFQGF